MPPTTLDLLRKAAEELDIEYSIHDEYSGREMMMGKTTNGIQIGYAADLYALIAYAGAFLAEEAKMDINNKLSFVDDAAHLKTDNLGRDLIVY